MNEPSSHPDPSQSASPDHTVPMDLSGGHKALPEDSDNMPRGGTSDKTMRMDLSGGHKVLPADPDNTPRGGTSDQTMPMDLSGGHRALPADSVSSTDVTVPMGPGSTSIPTGHDPTVLIQEGSQTTAPTESAVPEQVGRYRIISKLGEGGMGSVYKAADENGHEVALKLLRPMLVNEPGFAERFQREGAVAASVQHENVVRLFEHGVANGHHFMAFEMLSGGDVSDLIKRRGVLTEAKAMTVLRDATKGIRAIDEAGLIHRDIKPGNIFLDARDQVRIGDLGLARHTDGDDRMTMTGVAMGTPAYMSPEHVQGVSDIDIRTDLYALGATLYKMLTGNDPYVGDTLYMVTSQVLHEPSPDPRAVDPQISPEAAAIVRKAMTKKREDRYQTPDELIKDLEAALSGQRLLYAQVDLKVPKVSIGERTRRHVAKAAGVAISVGRGGSSANLRMIRWGIFGAMGLFFLYALGKLPDLLTVPEAAGPAQQDWASEAGRDEHGHWATLPFSGVSKVRMRYIPPGKFMMGSPPGEEHRHKHESPHAVIISKGFWMLDQEVPQAMWQALMNGNPSNFGSEPRRPVEMVTWDDAQKFCRTLTTSWPGLVARLPTEAEWEYACRAGFTGPYGEPNLDPMLVGNFAPGPLRDAWWDAVDEQMTEGELLDLIAGVYEQHADDVRFQTKPCRSLKPNAWGLYDMHGNVAEWCLDTWDLETDYPTETVVDPVSKIGNWQIVRGGSWYEPAFRGRAAYRNAYDPGHADFNLGFRFVIEHVEPTIDDDAQP